MRDGSLPLLYDLALSLLPLWLYSRSDLVFLPVALGALVVPALSQRWRNGLVIAACFTLVDQVVLWSLSPTPWQMVQQGQALTLLTRTLAPYALVLVLISAVRIGSRLRYSPLRRRRAARRPSTLLPPVRPSASMRGGTGSGGGRTTTTLEETSPVGLVAVQPPPTVRRSAPTLQAMLQQVQRELDTAGVTLAVRTDGDVDTLPSDIKALMLRTLDVAVDNVISHAHASAMTISIKIDHRLARLEIRDNGVGLWDGTAEPPGFHQLKRLRYRAEELAGAFTVTEQPTGGVVVSIQLPLGTA